MIPAKRRERRLVHEQLATEKHRTQPSGDLLKRHTVSSFSQKGKREKKRKGESLLETQEAKKQSAKRTPAAGCKPPAGAGGTSPEEAGRAGK